MMMAVGNDHVRALKPDPVMALDPARRRCAIADAGGITVLDLSGDR